MSNAVNIVDGWAWGKYPQAATPGALRHLADEGAVWASALLVKATATVTA